MDKENTLIIIGKSPVLDEPSISGKASGAHLHYHTIGINSASYMYTTEYFAFVDNSSTVYYSLIHPRTKILTLPKYANENFTGEYYELFVPKHEELPAKNNTLAYCGFTHDMCLSWAYLKGFKNVILMGVADFTDEGKYTKKCDNIPFSKQGAKFNPSDKLKKTSINYINNTLSKLMNIYTINPESVLDVPRITVKEF